MQKRYVPLLEKQGTLLLNTFLSRLCLSRAHLGRFRTYQVYSVLTNKTIPFLCGGGIVVEREILFSGSNAWPGMRAVPKDDCSLDQAFLAVLFKWVFFSDFRNLTPVCDRIIHPLPPPKLNWVNKLTY